MSTNEAGVTDLKRGNRKTREGLVVSDKMDKTVVVAVEDRFKHPMYGKVVRRTSKLKAHDEANAAGIGDRVLLMETRPTSATALARGRDPREGKVATTSSARLFHENRQTIRRMQ
jgi:small subunit ribosomal protein S17